jgi:HEAT repeat protein
LCRSHATKQFAKEAVYYAIKAYKESKPLWHVIRMYAGNIVLDYADDEQYEEIIKIARNDYHQDLDVDGYFNSVERGFFVEVLAKMKKHPEVVDELIKLLDDEDVRWHVIKSLGSQKNPKALPYLKKYLDDPDKNIRKYTASAISKIEKAQEKVKKRES